ncbi:hypothetical protein VNO78_20782 [Psophocarpus tetragonolobus]|uniref:Uncharacterized protein n=1 Tax=Psophocarpus tetragonolobus TaxID=3891 RepID=A0AAN9XH23_PSOTE
MRWEEVKETGEQECATFSIVIFYFFKREVNILGKEPFPGVGSGENGNFPPMQLRMPGGAVAGISWCSIMGHRDYNRLRSLSYRGVDAFCWHFSSSAKQALKIHLTRFEGRQAVFD